MRTFFVYVVVCVLGFVLVGCGGGEDTSTSNPDTSKPLDGKDVGKPSQLTGTWLAMNEGDFLGFEFMKDNKALVTHAMAAALGGANSGVMLTYDILDGGRLSLTAANGQTQVFGVTMSGDQFEIKGQMMFADTDTQRFRKLPAGQTLEQAFEEQQRAEAKERQERYAKLQEWLKQPGLVIVCRTPGPNAPPAIAMTLSDDGQPHRAWHDDSPPHVDQISASVDLNENGNAPLVQVHYGQQLDPAPTQPFRGGATISFEATGDLNNPTAVAKVNYGGQQFDLELKKDEKLHREIVGRFDAEKARIAALRQPLIDALSDYAILEGTSGPEHPSATAPDPTRIILVRDAASGNYTGETTITRGMNGQPIPIPQTSAQITVINDQPMLFVNAYSRQYQLTLDEAGSALTGGWFVGSNPNGKQAQLTIIETMDESSRAAKFAAERAALASISSSEPFVGLMMQRLQFLPRHVPASLSLNVAADGAVTGTASYPIVRGVYEVKGRIADTLAGPQIELQFANMLESGSHHAGNMAQMLINQRVAYRIAKADDNGSVAITDGVQTLSQAAADDKSKLREHLLAALGSGMTVVTTAPASTDGNPMTWQLSYDAGTNQITGSVVSGTMIGGFHPQSTIVGELQELNDMPMLLVQVADPPPARQGAFHRTYTSEIVACLTADGWQFDASYWADNNAMARGYFEWVQAKE